MTAASPVRMRGDAESFRLATDPRLVHHWAELIQTLALRVSQPWQVNPRLRAAWEQAGQNSLRFALEKTSATHGVYPRTRPAKARKRSG